MAEFFYIIVFVEILSRNCLGKSLFARHLVHDGGVHLVVTALLGVEHVFDIVQNAPVEVAATMPVEDDSVLRLGKRSVGERRSVCVVVVIVGVGFGVGKMFLSFSFRYSL